VVVAPGSRSTPLVLAAATRSELTLHVRLDERSAGFFALGRALVTGRPVAVVVTSGTAAAELHACVAEADLAQVPLLILTADRPPELHGVGAPQTIEQGHLYGPMVRLFEDPGVARDDLAASWRPLARRLWRAATGAPGLAGPVHLNAPFVEPLLADPLSLPPEDDDEVPLRPQRTLPDASTLRVDGARVLCVVGRGVGPEVIAHCRALDWVVLGDATAQGSLPYYDALLRSPAFCERARPDLVVRLGGIPASKVLGEQLRTWRVRTVSFSGAGFVADPDRLVSEAYDGLPERRDVGLAGSSAYLDLWQHASALVQDALDERRDALTALDEPLVASALVRASTTYEVPLVIGSSMPVRDVEWWAPARTTATFANRGANGIDGVVSTVLGVATGSSGIGLVGDLTFLHDVSAMVDGLGEAGGRAVLVILDNGGGGIFSFLPPATELAPEIFERFFATPRRHQLESVAHAFGHAALTVQTLDELERAIEKGLASEGLTVVVAKVPSREENVRLHATMNDLVTKLLEENVP